MQQFESNELLYLKNFDSHSTTADVPKQLIGLDFNHRQHALGRQQILRLYKHLIRYGNQLQLTDKTYFLGRIRREFKEGRNISDPLKIEFNFKRGETLLRNGRIL